MLGQRLRRWPNIKPTLGTKLFSEQSTAKRTEIDQRYISRIEDVGADWALIHMGRNLVQTSDDGFFSLQWRCGSCQEIEGEQRECPVSNMCPKHHQSRF